MILGIRWTVGRSRIEAACENLLRHWYIYFGMYDAASWRDSVDSHIQCNNLLHKQKRGWLLGEVKSKISSQWRLASKTGVAGCFACCSWCYGNYEITKAQFQSSRFMETKTSTRLFSSPVLRWRMTTKDWLYTWLGGVFWRIHLIFSLCLIVVKKTWNSWPLDPGISPISINF